MNPREEYVKPTSIQPVKTREEKAADSLAAFKQFWKNLFSLSPNPGVKATVLLPTRRNAKDKRASYSKRAAKAATQRKAIEVLADRARDAKKVKGARTMVDLVKHKTRRVLRIEPNPGFLNKNLKRLQHNVEREQ